MQLGVDFGTTRTVVAWVDRGNYPIVGFIDPNGDSYDHYPSVAALVDGALCFGFEAQHAMRAGAPGLRSFKRALANPDVGAHTRIRIGDWEGPLSVVLAQYLAALATALRTASNVAERLGDEALAAVVAVPAHAHSAQRFMTLQAFRAAGFQVTAILNEPSAAGFEYTHRQARTLSSRRSRVLVYDLGGGTFDASLVSVQRTNHEVIDTVGINVLGGDDFDEVLAELALEAADKSRAELSPQAWIGLMDEARAAKEAVTPQARRIPLEVVGQTVTVDVAEFYQAVAPLVEHTVFALGPLISGLDDSIDLSEIAGIYLVGGASGLPLVPRLLREEFGRRVHRSPYPAASTAIGLAIAADDQAGFALTDRLSRGIGVFRETEAGAGTSFDAIFRRDQRVKPGEAISVTRRYRAAHNIGCFRLVEYTGLSAAGVPSGELVPFAEVRFPFDAALQPKLEWPSEVVRTEDGPMVEERYEIDADGVLELLITDLDTGHQLRVSLDADGEPLTGSARDTT